MCVSIDSILLILHCFYRNGGCPIQYGNYDAEGRCNFIQWTHLTSVKIDHKSIFCIQYGKSDAEGRCYFISLDSSNRVKMYRNWWSPIQYGNYDAEWRCISFDLVACELLCPRTNYLVDLSRFTNHGMLVFATCVIVQGLVPTTILSIQVTCGSFLSLSGTLMWHGRISRSSLSHCLLTSFIQLILYQVQCSMWMSRHWISHIWCKSHIFTLA